MPLARAAKPKVLSRRGRRPPDGGQKAARPRARCSNARSVRPKTRVFVQNRWLHRLAARETLAKSKAAQQSAVWTASLIPLQEIRIFGSVGVIANGSVELIHAFGTQ